VAGTRKIDPGDEAHLRAALGLAARGLGQVWPNPAVGCVIVRDGRVVGRGWTQAGGRPHAETEALRRAGEAARGATAYVTLEPCAHHGQTPPCSKALIEAGISRAVIALEDPDQRVAGRGLADMRAAGIAVTTDICAGEAAELNAGFLLRIRAGRPLVTVKLATSLDGRIATRIGESQWITGEAARARAHLLRATHDAIMIGVGTAVADNPELTCRLPGWRHKSPVRIVVDGNMRLPLTSRLVRSAHAVPTWLITLADSNSERRQVFVDCGVKVFTVPHGPGGMPDLVATLQAVGAQGLTRVLVEGGGRFAASLARADLIDRIAWFRSASLIGGDGLAAVAPFGLELLADQPRFQRTGFMPVGQDILESFARRS
jgi:diaminohydroxyphosphoribosylaminopyrimidine deaminase / 5-amino-6-(5-phosphoribosylamino)uracil reductase